MSVFEAGYRESTMNVIAPFLSWPTAVVGSVVALIGILFWRRFISPLRNIPGPALASVSRLWHLRQIIAGDQNVTLTDLHDKHGHFVRIAPNEVSVSHPDAVKKILLAPLFKADWYKIMAIPDYRFQSPTSTLDPKKKMARSKHFASGWSLTNILQNEPAVNGVIEQLLNWMDQYAESKEPMYLGRWFTFTAFDTVGEAIFSKQFGFLKQGQDIGGAIANSRPLNAYATIMGFFRWAHVLFLGNPVMTASKLLPMGHLFDTSVQAVEERLSNKDSRFDVLAHWLRSLDRNPKTMTMRDIYAMATGAVGAGSDTITCALQSFFHHMLAQPKYFDRVHREIEEARKLGMCEGRVVSFTDAQQLEFLQACVKECLRIFTPVPMTLPRVAPKGGLTIGDQHFPSGTIVSINPWVIHYSKELWGPDAREFKPERWLEGDIAEKEKFLISFGAGYNACPGQNLAKVELLKITSTLIRDYSIKQEGKDQWSGSAYFIMLPTWGACLVEKRPT